MGKVILQGGGEHARVVLDALLSMGVEVVGIFDPKYQGELFGVPQRGVYDPSFEKDARALVAIGNNETRQKAVRNTRHDFTTCIHHSAIVSVYVSIGEGSMILHGTIVQPGVKLGKHVIVNTKASIDHDCRIGDFVHVAPGATLCGTVEVGEGTLIGAGATVLPGIKIGAWAMIGAGAVVTQDVRDNQTVVGNPARVLKVGS